MNIRNVNEMQNKLQKIARAATRQMFLHLIIVGWAGFLPKLVSLRPSLGMGREDLGTIPYSSYASSDGPTSVSGIYPCFDERSESSPLVAVLSRKDLALIGQE